MSSEPALLFIQTLVQRRGVFHGASLVTAQLGDHIR